MNRGQLLSAAAALALTLVLPGCSKKQVQKPEPAAAPAPSANTPETPKPAEPAAEPKPDADPPPPEPAIAAPAVDASPLDAAIRKALEQALTGAHCLLQKGARSGLEGVYEKAGFKSSADFARAFSEAREVDGKWAELVLSQVLTAGCE
ncbi:MAG: hypothetical protein ACI9WU_003317 [Myxococcota bacterium]|jgi:hypothetical protein